MQIHRDAVEIVIQTPAKLNLFFEVLGKRSDGYHEIETLMCPIGWYDTLCFRRNVERRLGIGVPAGFGGRVPRPAGDGSGFEEVPRDGRNLVLRAVDLVRRRTGTKQGARLRLIKRIPDRRRFGRWFQRCSRRLGGRKPGMETWPVVARACRPGGGTGQRRAVFPQPRSGRLPRPR